MDGEFGSETYKTGGNSSISLFLGLFLLVLAFFIMLVSISTIEETRSQRVMDSLTSTFAELVEPLTEPTDFVSQHGDVLEPAAFQAELTNVFTTAISATKVEIIKPGRDMRIDLLARELFEDDSLELRIARLPMIDRIVSSLSRNPPGIRFQAQIMAAVPTVGDGGETEIDIMRAGLDRAGAIARKLIERGAPPETISAGIYAGEADAMRFDFFIRREDELLIDFGAAIDIEYAPAETPADAPVASP